MKLASKAIKAVKDGGITTLVKRTARYLYKEVSWALPQRFSNYNGVKVPSYRYGEHLIKNKEFDRPTYEKGIINSMEENIRKDDKVVVLGGGIGVTAATAAKLCGDASKVELFEGSKDQVRKIEKTLGKNNSEAITVNHAVVGEKIDIWGTSKDAEHISPSNLPKCDVLEMDIEGSEIGVLNNLEVEPRVIIVESHGKNGSSTEEVKKILKELSYEIKNIELAEDKEIARKNDIKVITATK